MFKTIANDEKFGPKHWIWPEYDTKLRQINSMVHDCEKFLHLLPDYRTCIQAGGACGVWPAYLAQMFEQVYTFEPDFVNYNCLLENTHDIKNITATLAALSNTAHNRSMTLPPSEQGNAGAKYLGSQLGGETQCLIIDNLGLVNVDLIYLDIEGHEYQALMGAHLLLERDKPMVVIEAKPLPQYADPTGNAAKAGKYLESLGYKCRMKIKWDYVYTC